MPAAISSGAQLIMFNELMDKAYQMGFHGKL